MSRFWILIVLASIIAAAGVAARKLFGGRIEIPKFKKLADNGLDFARSCGIDCLALR